MATKKEKAPDVNVKAKGDVDTLKTLQAQPKMPVMIPVSENMEPMVVAINGCIYTIPRGVMVQVPESIYKIVSEAQLKTMTAKAQIAIQNK